MEYGHFEFSFTRRAANTLVLGLASSGRHLRIFPSEISCGEEIDQMLHGRICVMIRLLDFRWLWGSVFRAMLKERVRERAADALMKQNEERSDPKALLR